MLSERNRPKLFLKLGFLLLFLLILFAKPIRKFTDFQFQKLEVYKTNLFAPANPEVVRRRKPISTALEESNLEVAFGEPFSNFSLEEWDDFWEVIYGLYPKGEPEKPGLPRRLRQLTTGEIISELIARYPQIFRYFRESDWEAFFSAIERRE
jgi:hypothetical protein